MVLTSCQRDLDSEFVDFESHLVINSTFSPDSNFVVSISKSGNILDALDNIEPVLTASVFIEHVEENNIVPLIHQGEGIYYCPELIPVADQTYKLTAFADGFKSVTATSKVPAVTQISNIDTMTVLVEGLPGLQVDFDIENGNIRDGFFVWDVIRGTGNVKDIGAFFSPSSPSSSDYLLHSLSPETDAPINSTSLLQNLIFLDGKSLEEDIFEASFITVEGEVNDGENTGGETSSGGETGGPTQGIPSLHLRVISVSEELYEYTKFLERYKLTRQLNNTTTNLPLPYSNVSNGLGIFGGFNLTVVEI